MSRGIFKKRGQELGGENHYLSIPLISGIRYNCVVRRDSAGRNVMTSSAKLDADMGNSDDSMIEAMGGVQGIQTLIEERQSMFVQFWAVYSSLLEQHPDKWIAWGKEGVVGVSDSQDGLLSEIRSKNITANDVMVEFLDTDPKGYIL